MKRVIIPIAILLLVVLPVISFAQSNTTRFFFAYTYGNLTVDSTSGGVPFPTSKVTNGTNSAELVNFTIECAAGTDCPIRITYDGTAPTTTVGMRLNSGQSASLYAHSNIVRFRAIREGATSATLNVTYLR